MQVRINPWIYTHMPDSVQVHLNMHKLENIKDCIFTLNRVELTDASRFDFYQHLTKSENQDFVTVRKKIPLIRRIINGQVPVWVLDENPTGYDRISEWLLVPFEDEPMTSIY